MYFNKALPIFSKKHIDELNVSLVFVSDFILEEVGVLKITGNSLFRIYDNGEYLGYGPARAAHGYYRVESYTLNPGQHRLAVELVGYNCNSFYTLNERGFLQAEVTQGDKVISSTGSDFKCYLNSTRYQKVTRFSFQRTFAESYKFDYNLIDTYKYGKEILLDEMEIITLEDKKLLPRNVSYSTTECMPFEEIESGNVYLKEDNTVYKDRYMDNYFLKIFYKTEYEIDPNDIACKMQYFKKNIEVLQQNCFKTYKLEKSKTGFIAFDIEVKEDAEVYLMFDEILSKPIDDTLNICFHRNETHNIVTYEFKKGIYNCINFEPYTMQYLRVAVLKGEIELKNLRLSLYENSEINFINFNFENKKVQAIIDAAISTFAQNAVDILTDCPSRERAGWLCDSYFTSMAEYLITGSNKIEYNFLENYSLFEHSPYLPENMIPMCYPADFPDGSFIPNWSLFYILELRNYLNRLNDKDLIVKSIPMIKGLLKYFSQFENELGLLEDLKGWIFVEWSKANDIEYVSGVNFPSNMLYSAALEAAAELLDDTSLKSKADHIKEQINKYSFNGKFYEDNMLRDKDRNFVQTGHITETCQYYAFYFNVASKETRPELFDTLLNEFGPTRDDKTVYPEICKSNIIVGDYFRLFILQRYNLHSLVVKETVDYFYNMSQITGTLWEHENDGASLNHGLTSVVVKIALESFMGIKHIDFINKKLYLTNSYFNKENVTLSYKKVGLEVSINNEERNVKHNDDFEVIYCD